MGAMEYQQYKAGFVGDRRFDSEASGFINFALDDDNKH